MGEDNCRIIVAEMTPQRKLSWSQYANHQNKQKQQHRLFLALFAVFILSVSVLSINGKDRMLTVMSRLTTEFEYDETLGRLQFVSNILPESAMVFLQNDTAVSLVNPIDAVVTHMWKPDEPWIEYNGVNDALSAEAGEIMSIVSKRNGESTVRILHSNGYESIYSGLQRLNVKEGDRIDKGETVGQTAVFSSYELRKDGMSVEPFFSGREEVIL
ncbi:MAG: M23 family metallopeptidase [Clostridia bacterium]|nr:M23 family metallopeptidase [Clostridia bacterium]